MGLSGKGRRQKRTENDVPFQGLGLGLMHLFRGREVSAFCRLSLGCTDGNKISGDLNTT